MAGTASGVAGNIAVTAYRASGGSKVDSTTAYVIAQRGSRLFKISLEDSTTGVYCLKAVAPGSLPSSAPSGSDGTFCVQIILDDSTVAYVSKFFNNTAHYVTAAGVTGSTKYTLGTEATDGDKIAVGNIDVITDQ